MNKFFTLGFAAILLASLSASAATKTRVSSPTNQGLIPVSDKKYRAGANAGLGVPFNDDFGGTRALVGVDFYIAHDSTFDFGASYLTGGGRHTKTERRWRANFVGLELNYKLTSDHPGFYLGASAGLVSFDGGDAFLPGFDDLYFGPKAGFLRMITRELSWGLEGKLLAVTRGPFSVWFDALGTFHYHF